MKKRKKRIAVQKAVLVINPKYLTGVGIDPTAYVNALLLKSHRIRPFQLKPVFISQEEDTGNWFYFFKTAWDTRKRDYCIITRPSAEIRAENMVTCVVNESTPDINFGTYDYDIDYHQIGEIHWDNFKYIVEDVLLKILMRAMQDESIENLAFAGSLVWFPSEIAGEILKFGDIPV